MRIQKGISVIICAYTNERWDCLVAGIESLHNQTLPPTEIIVVIDHNPELFERVQQHISGITVIENKASRGLAGSRNTGLTIAQGEYIAFLDDDARPSPGWLQFIYKGFEDTQVIGVGGAIFPDWMTRKAPWFPEEFLWVVGCTYLGMPVQDNHIRNLIGANMAVRWEVFDAVGDFHTEMGRIGTLPLGCEETELCIRAHQHWPDRYFLYQAEASVFHRVPDHRLRWRYFCSRCYCEGVSKAFVTRYVGAQDGLASERDYTFKALPSGVLRGLADTIFRFDLSGIARSIAIFVGLIMTIIGYLVGMVVLPFIHSSSTTTINPGSQSQQRVPSSESTYQKSAAHYSTVSSLPSKEVKGS